MLTVSITILATLMAVGAIIAVVFEQPSQFGSFPHPGGCLLFCVCALLLIILASMKIGAWVFQ